MKEVGITIIKRTRLPAVLLACLLLAGLAAAGFIQLTTNVGIDSISVGANQSASTVSLSNTGDDTAYSVFISAWTAAPGITVGSQSAGELGPNASATVKLQISLSDNAAAGTHPLAVIVGYQDANGYSFSSVAPTVFSVGSPTQSSLQITPPSTSIDEGGSGSLSVNVKNLDDDSVDATLYLILPRELASNGTSIASKQVQLDAKTEKTVDFPASSIGALAGSTYVIALFAVNYDSGVASTAFGRGTISIGRQTVSPFILAALAVLLLAAAYVVYTQLKDRRG